LASWSADVTGTLVVCIVLLGYRRALLAPLLDRPLLGDMLRFGVPLAASGLALWAINLSDRFFLVLIAGQSETGVDSIAVRISSVVVLLLTAFRLRGLPSPTRSKTTARDARRSATC
jgi:O-antigen/teichoic acid export membrane protein